jgi:hypothetical protein
VVVVLPRANCMIANESHDPRRTGSATRWRTRLWQAEQRRNPTYFFGTLARMVVPTRVKVVEGLHANERCATYAQRH